MQIIKITTGNVVRNAELCDTPTARKLFASLPMEGSAQRWGEEIYFSIPLGAELEKDAREEMQVGEIAFWPPGRAFCIFFGRTPASSGDAPTAASPVNVLGKIVGDAKGFGAVRSGTKVTIEKAD